MKHTCQQLNNYQNYSDKTADRGTKVKCSRFHTISAYSSLSFSLCDMYGGG